MARLGQALYLSLSLAVAACGTSASEELPTLDPPEISLAGLTLGQSAQLKDKIWVDLLFENPNDFDIAIEQLDVEIEINRKYAAVGQVPEEVSLPGGEGVTIAVLMTMTGDDPAASIAALDSEDVLDYLLRGEAAVDKVPGHTLEFERGGVLEPYTDATTAATR